MNERYTGIRASTPHGFRLMAGHYAGREASAYFGINYSTNFTAAVFADMPPAVGPVDEFFSLVRHLCHGRTLDHGYEGSTPLEEFMPIMDWILEHRDAFRPHGARWGYWDKIVEDGAKVVARLAKGE